MARNRAKDNLYFNCSQEHERNYVVSLYSFVQQSHVRTFLINGCQSGLIHYKTHLQVYQLIKDKLGYEIPI
ncbi:MAG: hypothetical protein U0W65_14800 [Bacteroidia bacterium]